MNAKLAKAAAVLFAIGASVVGAAFALGSWMAVGLLKLLRGRDERKD